MLDGLYVTMSISTGLYPNLDLWTANKLQLQLQCHPAQHKYTAVRYLCDQVFTYHLNNDAEN